MESKPPYRIHCYCCNRLIACSFDHYLSQSVIQYCSHCASAIATIYNEISKTNKYLEFNYVETVAQGLEHDAVQHTHLYFRDKRYFKIRLGLIKLED